ncbi:DUF4433 domain-containing protein [Ramlibacter sp.]|uniref:type II toxin-antitoxin system toxin DNA ADP-ribosyl transferase DarT n=1 Tax=Ramlibacter sp. TaxID=1917967 RepID=UPI002A5F335C|nr:hypothetical protein [Ramlibacter sp.]
MPRTPANTAIYHITDVANLPRILQSGGLYSDVALTAVGGPAQQIGYGHIKQRRMTQLRVDCCGNRFVGEFVPFYYCPRSVMLYTINMGNTGLPKGCQTTVVHLVSTVATGISLGRAWAISDGNAGAAHATFSPDPSALEHLDWSAIEANSWGGRTHQKAAEFLVADFFPWTAISHIGCHNAEIQAAVTQMLVTQAHRPPISVNRHWYYG